MRNSSTPQPRTSPARQVRRRRRLASVVSAVLVLGVVPVLMISGSASAEEQAPQSAAAHGHWKQLSGKPAKTKNGHQAEIAAEGAPTYSLDRSGMESTLEDAPQEDTTAAAVDPLVVSLPAPDGTMQRFALQETSVMEAELAAKHPEIKTYAGKGIDDPTAPIRADLTPLGFHASVRSPRGAWYIDPYYQQDQSVYASYYARDLERAGRGVRGARGRRVHGGGAAGRAWPPRPSRSARRSRCAPTGSRWSPTRPTRPTSAPRRDTCTGRAKVTLVNRVNQIYEDETAIRLVLIDDTDKTNLNTTALATEPNGPCGSAACFTAAPSSRRLHGGLLTRNRIVLGQIIGASNYDIGHIGLGVNGGGVAG